MPSLIKAFVVDDEPPARARLRQLLSEIGDVLVVGEAGDPQEARAAIALIHPDVVFLDIEMPESSGTALAATLPEPRPFIVFATAFERYALDAFGVDATDYLLKPITRARLAGALARVRERLERRSDFDREMVAASAAQAGLLRRLLVIPGFDSAAATLPARAVGGDFYLAQSLGSGRYSFALGDVAGKGVPAGLVASSLQARIETMGRHGVGTPADVVADVNRALCGTIESARFATLIYLELDAERGTVQLVNAGHPAVIIVSPDGSRALGPSTGPALGLLPDAHFDVHTFEIPPGGVLAAYSDGVTEAMDDEGEELGEARLAQAVQRHLALGADHLCRTLLELARDHRGGAPAADDVTVMVIKRN
jgi:sigma-B regulation protein RsbU (phosphoserine phosphatase)